MAEIDVKAIRERLEEVKRRQLATMIEVGMEQQLALEYYLQSLIPLRADAEALLAEVERQADAIRILDRICEGQFDTIKAAGGFK